MAERPLVCVLGLGLMGRPMARRLAAAGFDVCGWNRTPLDRSLTREIPLVGGLAEAADADVLVLMLADSRAVGDVLVELEPLLRSGQLVVDMGSSDPRDSVDRASRLTGRGIGWVDAPVSGGTAGAESGRLAIMAGGAEADVDRALPVLSTLGESVLRVGGAGAGHTAKVANQLIVGLAHEAVAEALVLAESAGVEPALLRRALRGGWADSRVLQEQGERMAARNYAPGGKVRTLVKDLELARELAVTHDLELPHLKSALCLFSALEEQGAGELDCAVVVDRLRQRSLREKA